MIPDPREWLRWADEPDTGQALRFHVARRWPFPMIGWKFRGSDADHDTLYTNPRYEAFTSFEAAAVQYWMRTATELFVNRGTAPRMLSERACLRKGFSCLRAACQLMLAGKWDASHAQVTEAHNMALRAGMLSRLRREKSQREARSARGAAAHGKNGGWGRTIEDAIRENPTLSNNEIAKIVGCSKTTVLRYRDKIR